MTPLPASTTKGDSTRIAILDAAVAAASTVGLEGLSIGQLAKETGLSKSGLFAHFDSKENLQLQVLARATERFVETVIAPALKVRRGVPRLRAFFEYWLKWEKDPAMRGCFFLSIATELDDQPGVVRDRFVAYQRDWQSALATAARIAVEEGHFLEDLDVEQFAYDFFGMILAFHHFSRLMHDAGAEVRLRASFERLLADCRRPDWPDPQAKA
jgi:AcrR family transcriptional regulator